MRCALSCSSNSVPAPMMKKMPVMIHRRKVKAAVVLGKRLLMAVHPATMANTMSRPKSTAITMGRHGCHATLVLCSNLFSAFWMFCGHMHKSRENQKMRRTVNVIVCLNACTEDVILCSCKESCFQTMSRLMLGNDVVQRSHCSMG